MNWKKEESIASKMDQKDLPKLHILSLSKAAGFVTTPTINAFPTNKSKAHGVAFLLIMVHKSPSFVRKISSISPRRLSTSAG